MARHHVLEMIVFANEIWQIASITLNLPQNCTSTQAGRSFLGGGLDSVTFSSFFQADLFLNSVTDGGPVRDAVIMCEKPSNNRIDGDR